MAEYAHHWGQLAAQWDGDSDPHVISDAILQVAESHPCNTQGGRTRAAITFAAQAVGARFCQHGKDAPAPLPEIRNLAERQAAAKQHAGLCGYHHADCIGQVDFQGIVTNSNGGNTVASTKRTRNQACHDTCMALNARGRGVQLTRRNCFTQACRAVWPGDQDMPPAVASALL